MPKKLPTDDLEARTARARQLRAEIASLTSADPLKPAVPSSPREFTDAQATRSVLKTTKPPRRRARKTDRKTS
jgi:hypothetical protein